MVRMCRQDRYMDNHIYKICTQEILQGTYDISRTLFVNSPASRRIQRQKFTYLDMQCSRKLRELDLSTPVE